MTQDSQTDRSTSLTHGVDPQVASEPYVGRWHRLVSVTNWEKGRIICEWRDALIQCSAPVTEYSDEAWSRRVGNVSSQHVGRLRRVYQRFGDVQTDYEGLCWSHFQAALDWNDPELWLEGSVQNGWSVAQMRGQRWQALGAPAALRPRDEDIILGELDEDVDPTWDTDPPVVSAPVAEVSEPAAAAKSDGGAENGARGVESGRDQATHAETRDAACPVTDRSPLSQPFADLPIVPDDLTEALESLKLAILRHRLDGWQQVPCDDLLRHLDALRQLALAPPSD